MSRKVITAIAVILALLVVIYINAVDINPKQLTVREEIVYQTADTNKDFLIAYFSDICFNDNIEEEYLTKVINTINQFNPDLIVYGGDLIDVNYQEQFDEEKEVLLINQLAHLNAKYGKYCVLGDQDYFDIDQATQIYLSAGFKILDNDNHSISDDLINIVGIQPLINGNPDINKAFLGVDNNHLTFIFSHCPDLFDDIKDYHFDYFLAGHSLGGKNYIPIINYFYRPKGAEKYLHGKVKTNNKVLDITDGIGRLGSNTRLLTENEIVFYNIHFQSSKQIQQ